MTLTDNNLTSEKPHPSGIGGIQRLYRIGNYGLSCVNSKILHTYLFAWEIAILKYKNKVSDDFELVYDTELTEDVEVFTSDDKTNDFIKRAFILFEKFKKANRRK